MSQIHRRGGPRLAIALFVLALAFPATSSAKVIVVDGSIQDAVDAASPGDVILVPAGLYTGTSGDAVVSVDKDDITIKGSTAAVIDATGFDTGILVGPRARPSTCPQALVRNFKLQGLTIQNADDTGVRLVGVAGFSLTHSIYLDNEEYGPFPVCSSDGVIAHNFAAGHKDAAIYVGDDDGVVVRNNTVTTSAIGIEIENSLNSTIRANVITGNTAGILVVVLPGLPIPETTNVTIQANVIADNNADNPGGGFVGAIPPGTGILNVGGDAVTIRNNRITGHRTVGVAIIGNGFGEVFGDLRIDPFVDDNVVANNNITGNGFDAAPGSIFPGADIIFFPDVVNPLTGEFLFPDPDPGNNCFANNAFDSDFPPGVVSAFPCH